MQTKENSLCATWLSAYESVRELVTNLEAAQSGDDDLAVERARQSIEDDALEVSVRSGWHAPGSEPEAPAEYRILLSTGGPASRIVGELSEHGEPVSARLEVQDWGTPWVEYSREAAASAFTSEEWEAIEPTLLSYAREFYFGN